MYLHELLYVMYLFSCADFWGVYKANYVEKIPFIYLRKYLHSAPLGFSTQTKSSEDKTSFGTCYDVKEVRISQEKHLSSGFPLSYQLKSAGRAALVGRLAGTG